MSDGGSVIGRQLQLRHLDRRKSLAIPQIMLMSWKVESETGYICPFLYLTSPRFHRKQLPQRTARWRLESLEAPLRSKIRDSCQG